MRRRILIRSPRDPFQLVTPEATLDENLIGTNTGNLVFIDAAWKILSAPDVELTSAGMRPGPREADIINERYDVLVIPLANAFRHSFLGSLGRLTRLIERLRIPVVVLGVGAQGTLDGDWSETSDIEPNVKAFARAVLDHSPSIGVRGELTQAYLAGLGFRDVDVIGCPSMFMWGDSLHVSAPAPRLEQDAKIALTISPEVDVMPSIAATARARYPNVTYQAQDLATLGMLLLGKGAPSAIRSTKAPLPFSHPFFAEDRVRLYIDPWPWIRDLRTSDFCYGTRIHGAVAALLAGVPAYVLAHDSRTLELAQYFQIPHRRIDSVPPELDPATLYAEADYAALHAAMPDRFATFLEFLARHDLDNSFAHPGAAEAFDARVAATPLPPAVTAVRPGGVRARYRHWRWVRDRTRREERELRQAERRRQRERLTEAERDRDPDIATPQPPG